MSWRDWWGLRSAWRNFRRLECKRISVGSALSRAALGEFLRAAREMREQGTFSFAEQAVSYRDVSAMFAE